MGKGSCDSRSHYRTPAGKNAGFVSSLLICVETLGALLRCCCSWYLCSGCCCCCCCDNLAGWLNIGGSSSCCCCKNSCGLRVMVASLAHSLVVRLFVLLTIAVFISDLNDQIDNYDACFASCSGGCIDDFLEYDSCADEHLTSPTRDQQQQIINGLELYLALTCVFFVISGCGIWFGTSGTAAERASEKVQTSSYPEAQDSNNASAYSFQQNGAPPIFVVHGSAVESADVGGILMADSVVVQPNILQEEQINDMSMESKSSSRSSTSTSRLP